MWFRILVLRQSLQQIITQLTKATVMCTHKLCLMCVITDTKHRVQFSAVHCFVVYTRWCWKKMECLIVHIGVAYNPDSKIRFPRNQSHFKKKSVLRWSWTHKSALQWFDEQHSRQSVDICRVYSALPIIPVLSSDFLEQSFKEKNTNKR